MNKVAMWFLSMVVSMIVNVLIYLLGKAISCDLSFLQGWFSCMAYAITYFYLILKYDNK